MQDAEYWNRLAGELEKEGANFYEMADEHLTADWAAEAYSDDEVAGRHAARHAILQMAVSRYRRAGEYRAKAYAIAVPAPKVEA